MTCRPRRRYLVSLAAGGALLLSGCTFHPGSAAVVNGTAISQGQVDDLVLAACSFSKARRLQTGGSAPATSVAFLRNALLQNLLSFQISHLALSQLGLSVSEAAVAKVAAGQTIPASVSSHDKQLLSTFFSNSDRSQLEQAVIGAHLKDPSVTNADHVTPSDVQAAQKYLTAFTKRQHVTINPAYGTWSGQQLIDSDGSLSAPESPAAARWLALRTNNSRSVAGLPPSQVCG